MNTRHVHVARGTLHRLLVIVVLSCAPLTNTFAQRGDVAARIALKNHSGTIDVILTGRRGDTLYARLLDSNSGSITYEVADIQRIAIRLPEEILQRAEQAAEAGNLPVALRTMRSALYPVMAMLNLPTDGVIEPALRYAEWLRRESSWSAAITVYNAMVDHPDSVVNQQARAWLAYCLARNQQPKEAASLLATAVIEDPQQPGYLPATLAGALLALSTNDFSGALDLASRAAALSRIDHELYPEAVFTSAQAYHRMAEEAALQPERHDVALKKAGAGDVRMSPMTADEFLATASNMYTQITVLFPSSSLAADAAKQRDRLVAQQAEKTGNPIDQGAQP